MTSRCLIDVEWQLVMHFLPSSDLLRLGRCSSQLSRCAATPFAWSCTALSVRSTPQRLKDQLAQKSALFAAAPLELVLLPPYMCDRTELLSKVQAQKLRRMNLWRLRSLDCTPFRSVAAGVWQLLLDDRSALRHLRVLIMHDLHRYIRATDVNAELVTIIASMPHLHTLQIDPKGLDSAALTPLASAPCLTDLRITASDYRGSSRLEQIAACPLLQSLLLHGPRAFTATSFRALFAAPMTSRLRRLVLYGASICISPDPVEPDDFRRAMSAMSCLREFRLVKCDHIQPMIPHLMELPVIQLLLFELDGWMMVQAANISREASSSFPLVNDLCSLLEAKPELCCVIQMPSVFRKEEHDAKLRAWCEPMITRFGHRAELNIARTRSSFVMSFDPSFQLRRETPVASSPSELLLAQLRDYESSSALRHGVHTVLNQVHPGCRLDRAAMCMLAHILASLVRRLLLPGTESGDDRVADAAAELKARAEASAGGTLPPTSLERWDEVVFDRLLHDRISKLLSGPSHLCTLVLREVDKATPRGRTRAQWRDVEPRSESDGIECMRQLGHVFPAPLTPLNAVILASPAFRLPHLMRQHVAAFLEFITAEWTEVAGSIAMMTEADGYDRAHAEADVEAQKHSFGFDPHVATIISSAHLTIAIRGDPELLSMMQRLGGDALERLQLSRSFEQGSIAQPIALSFPRTLAALDQLYKQFAWFHRSDAEIRTVLDRWLSGRLPLSPLAAMGIRPVSWFGRSCFPTLLSSATDRYSFPRHEADEKWGQDNNGPLVCIAFDLIDACGREYPLLLEHGRDEGAFFDRASRLKLGEWKPNSGFAFDSGAAVARFFAAFVPREQEQSGSRPQGYAQLSVDDAKLWQQARMAQSQPLDSSESSAVAGAPSPTVWPAASVVAELLKLIHRASYRDVGSVFNATCPLDCALRSHHPVRVIRLFSETQLRVAFDSELVGRRDMPQVLIELMAAYAPVDLPTLPLHTTVAVLDASSATGSGVEGSSSATPSAEFAAAVERIQCLLEDAPNFPFRI